LDVDGRRWNDLKDLFDLSLFDSYKEDNRREVKKAKGGLPVALWDSYSAFANCYGGVIILGVAENKDGSWRTTGLDVTEKGKLMKQFWDTINNRKKVSLNLLREDDVQPYEVGNDLIIVIYVPMAKREQRPIYINDDLFGSTFRRSHEGDYRCTRLQVKTMLRDQAENTMDMEVLDDVPLTDLNHETVQGYRNRHRTLKPGHPFEKLNDDEYLRCIGAAGISREDKQLHPTAAGMLMFGYEYNIVRHYPEYFLDYREMLDPTIRWTDRLQSSSGEWSGNLCDFYFRVYNKLIMDVKIPFAMDGGNRIEDTPVHKALREALANCLINADYYGTRGVVIKKEPKKIILENPGYIRTGKIQMRKGGESDPRNKALMKMFNLINIGERSGSGVPNIFNTWEDEGWKEPIIEERFDPDRTVLTLEFVEKQAIKTSDKKQAIKTSDKKQAIKTSDNIQKVREFLEKNGESKTSDIADYIDLSPARTRAILGTMDDVEPIGENRNRKYRLKE
jgi:predicted HTH transcriptional regulator